MRSRRPSLFLPVGTLLVLAMMVGLIFRAGKTLGYDFEAYRSAAHRVVSGERLYDTSVSVAGGFADLPLSAAFRPGRSRCWRCPTTSPGSCGSWPWLRACQQGRPCCRSTEGTLADRDPGSAQLAVPVLREARPGRTAPVPALGGGLAMARQRGPRCGDRHGHAGEGSAGTADSLGRGKGVSGGRCGVLVAVAVAAVATVVTGLGAWFDYAALLGRVSSAVTTLHNCSPGAVAFQAGAPEGRAAWSRWLRWRWPPAPSSWPGDSPARNPACRHDRRQPARDAVAVGPLRVAAPAPGVAAGAWPGLDDVFPLAGWISLFDSGSVRLLAPRDSARHFRLSRRLLWEVARERGRARSRPPAATPAQPLT